MDNLCHTLVGLALGEAGLKKKTALGNATLLVGANLPDVDALSYAWGPVTALGFRRGWTHGVLALALWPFVLTGLMLAWDWLVRRRRRPDDPPADARGLLLLSAVAVASHPLLDLFNTYGVRWLMPFSGRWFYGDTLFIVDPWVWLALLTGILLSRRAERRGRPDPGRPAQGALVMAGLYAALMFAGGAVVRRALASAAGGPLPDRVMVAPVPVDPLRRDVVIAMDGAYAVGQVRLLARHPFGRDWTTIERHDDWPQARAAAMTAEGQTFLRWARFPFFAMGGDCPARHVCLRDARYYPQTWAEVAVPLAGPLSLPPPPSAPEHP